MLRHNAISDVDFFIEQVPINKWTNYLIFGVKKFDSKIGTSRKKSENDFIFTYYESKQCQLFKNVWVIQGNINSVGFIQ